LVLTSHSNLKKLNTMNKYLALFTILIISAFSGSCTKQLDEVTQRGALDTDTYYAKATDEQAIALITSVYTSAWGVTTDQSQAMTDDVVAYGVGVYGGAATSTANMTGGFQTYYQINYKCNMIIEKMTENSAVKTQVIGEAYFWRAWSFLNLIRGWGTPPLIDHVLGASELKPSNGDPAALWSYVFTSLEKAITRLPSKASANGQLALGARVTKEAAYAVLGKASLWSGDKAKAVTNLAVVVNSNLYGLLDNFADLYSVKADWSKEYMWEFNAQDNDNDNKASEARLTFNNVVWRAENVTMPGGVHLSGFNQGYSTSFPSKSYYDFLIARGEAGKPRQMGTAWSIADAANMFVTLSGPAYVGTPNYEGNYLKVYTDQGFTPLQAGYKLLWNNYGQPVLTTNEGYLHVKKYIHFSDMYAATSDKDLYSKANHPGMRYAEVLLLYAEACLGSTSQAAGLTALNLVRVRAGLTALGSYTLQDVKDEKRAELWGEGERFFDVVRWGDAATAFANVGKYSYTLRGASNYTTSVLTEPFSGWTGWQSKYALIPFPYTEIQLNTNLVQNPGWN
jgi:hypothetical protein